MEKIDTLKIGITTIFAIVCVFHLEAQAFLEHTTGWAYQNGYCRVRNVKAIRGNGELWGGVYADSREVSGHVRGFKNGNEIELTWLESKPITIDAKIKVKNYTVVEAKITSDEAARNLRYIKAALLTEYLLAQIKIRKRS